MDLLAELSPDLVKRCGSRSGRDLPEAVFPGAPI